MTASALVTWREELGMHRGTALLGMLLALCSAITSPTEAQDVRILAAGAVQKAVEPVLAAFRARTGNTVAVRFDTVGTLRDAVLAGDSPDLVLLSHQALQVLEGKGRLVSGSVRSVGRTGVGLAVKREAPAADISSPEMLKAVLLAAPSIAHADPARGATAGTHFRKVLGDLGIADLLAQRITVVPFGGGIAADVADGRFAIGVSQATEIVPHPGVRLLGLLPEPYALWTEYGAARVASPTATGSALVALLIGPEGQAAFRAVGFEPGGAGR